jgi:hypothetical protein
MPAATSIAGARTGTSRLLDSARAYSSVWRRSCAAPSRSRSACAVRSGYPFPLEVGDVVRVRAQREGENEALEVVVGHGEGLAPGELYPISAPLAWEGRRVPKRDRIVRLPFLPDPVSPDKPLLILVSTFSKKDVFGPDLGEVVAQGVDSGLTAQEDDVRHHMGWRAVAASAQQAWLMARYRAEEGN